MCYVVYLSTNAQEDLSRYDTASLRFTRVDEGDGDPALAPLAWAQQWHVGSASGCSCEFRHVVDASVEGFGHSETWMQESDEALAGTQSFYDVVEALVAAGHVVDCVDIWQDGSEPVLRKISVKLSEVPRDSFRFFEGCQFVFTR
jgi:hypothetical protein